MALQPGDGERLELPGADVRQRGGETRHQHVDLPAEHVGDRRANAAIVRVRRRLEAGRGPELLEREMVEEPDAAGAVVHLRGILARVIDEALQIARRHRGLDHQQVGRAADHRDRREVLDRVVRQLAHGRIGAVRADVADHQRVAVGRRARRGHRGDGAAGAAGVLDDERLVERARKLVGHGAADEVEPAARLCRHHDLHRLRRILRTRQQWQERGEHGDE